jgi:hypothetical protein
VTFRTFTRTWWADDACTIPEPGRKVYAGRRYASEDEARDACAEYNRRFATRRHPDRRRGPRGLCMEYEQSS